MTKLINVEYIDQSVKYPTGCETISTIMCLHYHKINITPDEFIDKYLDKGDVIKKDDQIFAPNPFDKFVGSPYDQNSFGCYEPVIEKALNKLISDKQLLNFEIKNLNNIPINTIIKDYNVDLVLSGHSHNGQINIPFIKKYFLPKGSRKYYDNYYKVQDTDLYISSGIGLSRLNLRMFNKPSINFYRINKITE